MTGNTKLSYALFPNREAASEALAEVNAKIHDCEVELLTQESDLTQDKIPLRHTMARAGTALGALMTAGLMLTALAGLMLLGVEVPSGVPSPYGTTAIVVVFAALFGGLAGALSFSTRAREELRRLRSLLRFGGNSLLLIETERNLDKMLRRRGAVQIGRLV
jgi:hypothetical protein